MSSCCSNTLLITNPTWWRGRSALERYLSIAIVTITVTGIGLLIGLIISVLSSNFENCNTGNTTSNAKNICLTHECIHSASKILKTIDTEVEPCDDFYKFACGQFLKTTVIPDHQDFVDTFSVIKDKLFEQLKISIEEEIKPDEPKPFKLAKNLYKACMNTSSINAKGLTPALEILKKLGGWPVIEGIMWRHKKFDWKQAVIQIRKLGIPVIPFFDIRVEVNTRDTSRRVIVIDHLPSTELQLNINSDHPSPHHSSQNFQFQHGNPNPDYLYTDEYQFNFMVDIAVIFGANRLRARKEMARVLQYKSVFKSLSETRPDRRINKKMTVRELSLRYPSIPWKEYINSILEPIVEIGEDELVLMKEPSFFTEFENLIKGTSRRLQANFLMYNVVSNIISYLSDDIRERQLTHFAVAMGQTAWEPRWKECIDTIYSRLKLGVSALYVQKYFNRESKKTIAEMVNNIRQELKKLLKQVKWMNEEIRQSALKKVDSMRTHIAYPDELLDNKKLNEFYEKLEITPDDYLQTILNVTIFDTDYSFSQLRKPVNKSDWVAYGFSASVNAFYSNADNSIAIPAGILQGAFYKNERPRFMNYGAIGLLIAHEIMHGFDHEGRNYDKDGNFGNSWNDQLTVDKYYSNAKCLVLQYDNYTVEEVKLNVSGLITLRENTADNEGFKISYLAYQEWVKRNGPELKLPGLVYTPSQLFWISAAQKWCGKIKPEILRHYTLYGTHSPHDFRIKGSLSNSLEFAKDFKCPVGSKMNPNNTKCSLI